jgi:hypothetical protein
MAEKPDNVKEAVADLIENLGTIGLFMLSEARAFLRKSWGSSREDFFDAVDKAARTMKQSGQIAASDIERTADRIKQSWELLDKEKNLDWDAFLNDLTQRLRTMGDVSRETFDLCVNQAKDALDKQWTAMGRLGEDQLKAVQTHTEEMSKAFKDQWSVFWDTMESTGKKVDRAVNAAWEELRKKE